MRNIPLVVVFLCAGCATGNDDAVPDNQPGNQKIDEELKSGQVNQLTFTSDGKYLVAASEFMSLNSRRNCHSRLRSFSVSDWKVAADTGKLSMVDLALAPCSGKSWMIQAQDFYPLGGNPFGAVVFFKLDSVTLKRTSLDVIQERRPDWRLAYFPSAVACAGQKQLCAAHVTPDGGGRSEYPAFVFDLKANKRTVELRDYPKGINADYFMKTVLAFTPDDAYIVSCQPCEPFQLQLHASDTGKLVRSIKLESPTGSVKFSPDGKMLAALCWNGDVLILAPDLSKQIHKFRVAPHNADRGRVPDGIAFVGDEHLAVVSGITRVLKRDASARVEVLSSSSKVELFDTEAWKTVHTFASEKNQINCVAGSPDGKLLAVGYGWTNFLPGKIRVFEVKIGKRVAEID